MSVTRLKNGRINFCSTLFVVVPVLMLLSTLFSRSSPTTIQLDTSTERIIYPPSPNLFDSARTHPETCAQWIAAQKSSGSYLDAFIIGAQKSGTTELSRRLGELGVRNNSTLMLKEWHFFYRLDEHGQLQSTKTPNQTFVPFYSDDLRDLRLRHYISGFPDYESRDPDQLPVIDESPIQDRIVTYDATVEYLISERNARLAQLVAPHARILLLMRNPIERAVSQYNMVVRVANTARDAIRQPNPAEFHYFIETEIHALLECGYDPELARYDGDTTELQDCVVQTAGHPRLHIFRGLYALHIETWLRYFPAHRFHFIRFSDILSNPEQHLRDVTRFLCVRDFPENLISEYRQTGRNVSFGQATTLYGAEGVQDDFGGEGQTKYMVDIWDKTRRMMEGIFRGSNQKLEWLLGVKCC